MAQNAVRAEDLERVKTQLIAAAIYAQDNQASLARWYGAALTTGLTMCRVILLWIDPDGTEPGGRHHARAARCASLRPQRRVSRVL